MTAIAYPSAIARACSALDEVEMFRSLPDGYFRVVVRIVKKINLSKLDAPILASRSTLAKEANKSVETVGRVVKWLEDRGLIQRSQKARAGLRGSSSPLVPTPKLLKALMLVGHQGQKKEAGTACPQGSSVRLDGSKSIPPVHPKGKQPQRGAFTRMGEVSIPTELVWLVEDQHLRPTAILALMAAAKRAKQRLTEVVALTRQYLVKLKGRDLFAYIASLLKQDKDFVWIAGEQRKEQEAERDKQRVVEKHQSFVGRKFSSRDGKILYVVGERWIEEFRDTGGKWNRTFDKGFLEALDDGRVVPYRASGRDQDE